MDHEDLLGPHGSIHSVDRDADALEAQSRRLRQAYPESQVTTLIADFGRRWMRQHASEGLPRSATMPPTSPT